MKVVFEVIEKLQRSNNIAELTEILRTVTELVEFDFFLLGIVVPNSITQSDVLIYDNYPQKWLQYYQNSDYMKRDPIVQYSMNNFMPITWSQISESEQFSKQDLSIMCEAHESGLKSGFSIPIHGSLGESGVISFASSNDNMNQQMKYADAIPIIQLLIPALQETLKRLRACDVQETSAKLTKREVECLTWATEGKSSWEISQILGCSERTAIFHLTNAAKKLGATNRYQAISKALLSGVINPSL